MVRPACVSWKNAFQICFLECFPTMPPGFAYRGASWGTVSWKCFPEVLPDALPGKLPGSPSWMRSLGCFLYVFPVICFPDVFPYNASWSCLPVCFLGHCFLEVLPEVLPDVLPGMLPGSPSWMCFLGCFLSVFPGRLLPRCVSWSSSLQ